ncbi:aminodeoxychorismate/anthranilate synthase component II (plasmid) [Buchnera aphidicola (Mollitrichosiphum nigrofasciatum)]|uniref:aminodeoxychorismate/anthranilate synthase component II n=1 Tax=Buchnera aphidicola TaxID=9 RepID=UPI0031B86CE3
MANILLIDNVDSFTYNLVEQLRINNNNVYIYRNTISIQTIIHKIQNILYPILMFSPGPGDPKNAGCMPKLLKYCKGKIPIIGICLGHQAIVEEYGGKISISKNIVHGKKSLIYHDQKYMFENIKNPFYVGRYHSLITTDIPKSLIVNAWYKKKIVMSVMNEADKVCGFQFHPESILTTEGDKLLNATIKWAENY